MSEIADRLNSLASKIEKQREAIETEEATKNAFVMPFISLVLGYDVFNPQEVIPEFTADVGTKKGEKIDYAIVKDGEVQILIECKQVNAPLTLNHASQLFRYFAASDARIAILTNGDDYHCYTDLDKQNRMDEKPFLQFTVTDFDPTLLDELTKLTKDQFDIDSVLSSAEELRYVGDLKRVLAAQFKAPDAEWVKFLANRVYEGVYTQKVREQFTMLVPKALKQFLSDQVNDRIKAALGSQGVDVSDDTSVSSSEASSNVAEASVESADSGKDGVNTTLEELEGYQIVRAIVCSEVDPARIAQRDTKSYFGILLDDNNRKPIARLHFNTGQKYLGLFDADKNETREPIEALTDIYKFADRLRAAVHFYD